MPEFEWTRKFPLKSILNNGFTMIVSIAERFKSVVWSYPKSILTSTQAESGGMNKSERRKRRRRKIRAEFDSAKTCIVCQEGHNSARGRLLEPCECHNEFKRFHYECLVGFLEQEGDRQCIHCHKPHKDYRIKRFLYSGPNYFQFIRQYLFGQNPGLQRFEGLTDCVFLGIIAVIFTAIGIKLILLPEEGDNRVAPVVTMTIAVAYFAVNWHFKHKEYLRQNYAVPHQMVEFRDCWGSSPDNTKIVDMTMRRALLRLEENEFNARRLQEMIDLGDI